MALPQSQVRVDSIINTHESGAVTVALGATVSSGYSFVSAGAGVNATGTATAGEFDGDGSGITNMSVGSAAKASAFAIIMS